jgi:hypothetical protein
MNLGQVATLIGAAPLKWSTHWGSFIPSEDDDTMSGKRDVPLAALSLCKHFG